MVKGPEDLDLSPDSKNRPNLDNSKEAPSDERSDEMVPTLPVLSNRLSDDTSARGPRSESSSFGETIDIMTEIIKYNGNGNPSLADTHTVAGDGQRRLEELDENSELRALAHDPAWDIVERKWRDESDQGVWRASGKAIEKRNLHTF